jgi:hypothetical protein
MSEPTYNEQIIRRYLIGALSETETEALDELSITDDEFGTALNVAEKELVDSYVKGELSADELENFKAHYLASPLRREKVDFSAALRVFGERSAGPSAAVVPAEGTGAAAEKARWFSGFGLFQISPTGWTWGFAGLALILLIVSGVLVFQNLRLRQQVNQTQARHEELQQRELEIQKQLQDQRTENATTEAELASVREERALVEEQLRSRGARLSSDKTPIASFILTPQLRGAGQIQTLTISPATERIAMRLQLEPNEYSTYSVALIDQSSGKFLWRGKGRREGTGDQESLSVNFRAALLRTGIYRMQVSGVSSSGASEVVGDYPFRVSR